MPVSQLLSVVGRGGGTTPPPTPQPAGLYAWEWDSDSVSGNKIPNTYYYGNGANYTSDQNVPLTFFNSPVTTTPLTWYNGNSGKQIRGSASSFFMQTPDFLTSGYAGAWSSSTRTGLTIELWFYPTNGARTLVSEIGTGGAISATWHDSIIELNSNGTVVADIWPYTGGSITTANSVNFNAWNHVIYTYNVSASLLSIQLNGGTVVSAIKDWTCAVENGGGLYYAIGYADATNLMANANTTNFDGYWGKIRIANYPMASNRVSDWAKYNSFSVLDSGTALGANWTVEVVGDFYPSNFWATMWGNDAWSPGTGHIAYLTGPNTLLVGAAGYAGNVNVYTLADNLSIKSYWAFTHTTSGGIDVYRNGTLLTPSSSNYVQPSSAGNTLIFGARHLNDGTGGTDPNVLDKLPGNYLYTNISASALSPATIASNYTTLQATYSIP